MCQGVVNREAESLSQVPPGELMVPRAREKPEAAGVKGHQGWGGTSGWKMRLGPDQTVIGLQGQCFSWGTEALQGF